MSGPLRLRWVNEATGALVLLCAVVFVGGILLAGREQGWFEKDFVLYTVFPKGALDLQKGAEVRIQGAAAGRVGDIAPNEMGALETTYVLRSRFRDLVRTNSVAVVKKKFQLAGDAYVEITLGDRRFPPMEPNARIESLEDVQLFEKLSEFLEDVRLTVVPMLEEVQGILVNVNGILTAVHEGQGIVGALLHDEGLTRRLEDILAEAERTAAKAPELAEELTGAVREVQALVQDLRRLSGEVEGRVQGVDTESLTAEVEASLKGFRTAAETADGLMQEAEIAGLLRETEMTMREIRRLMGTLQRHWLLRRYKEEPPAEGWGVWDVPATGEAMP